MKRVGICTLHDANPNFGATLQAFSLQEIVKKMGYNVEFLKFKEEKRNGRKEIKLKLKKLYPNSKFQPIDTKNITINKGIKKSNRYLNICKEVYDKEKHQYDSIIIGSDELWNLRNPSFIHQREYYGYGLNSQNVFAYAPSSNGTSKEIFEEYFNKDVDLEKINMINELETIKTNIFMTTNKVDEIYGYDDKRNQK